jgi:hypothetical protein
MYTALSNFETTPFSKHEKFHVVPQWHREWILLEDDIEVAEWDFVVFMLYFIEKFSQANEAAKYNIVGGFYR